MIDHTARAQMALLWLAVLAAFSLCFIMVALPMDAENVFLRRDSLSAVEGLMLVGFGVIVLFDVLSVAWLARAAWSGADASYGAMASLGLFCLILLAIDKVMVDEVGNEWVPGAGLQSEALILYGLLLIQLAYIGLVIQRLRPQRREEVAA